MVVNITPLVSRIMGLKFSCGSIKIKKDGVGVDFYLAFVGYALLFFHRKNRLRPHFSTPFFHCSAQHPMSMAEEKHRKKRHAATPIEEQAGNASLDPEQPVELGGPQGPDPTRYGDWERKGRCIDF
jgi:Uncharacterized conserved small protein